MKFWKMNGAGNDFIVLDNRSGALPEAALGQVARRVCERHLSLGADGLMVVAAPRQGGDYRMLFYNSDGSMGEMCGNGARCICRYGYENGLAGERQTVETTAGIVTGERISARQYRVRLNDPTTVRRGLTLEAAGRTVTADYVELGDPGIPHAAVEMPGLAQVPEEELRTLGRALRWHSAFPRGANVNFYEITGPDRVLERTYERGVEDFTYACGTGTGSVVTVLTLAGRVSGRDVRVTMRGGELTIDAVVEDGRVRDLYLTGPTNIVARGELTDEELAL
jgi:diaminopimelate epimerase